MSGHCRACDKILNDAEAAATFEKSGMEVGLCTRCAQWLPSDVSVVGMDVVSRLEDEEAPLGRDEQEWDEYDNETMV